MKKYGRSTLISSHLTADPVRLYTLSSFSLCSFVLAAHRGCAVACDAKRLQMPWCLPLAESLSQHGENSLEIMHTLRHLRYSYLFRIVSGSWRKVGISQVWLHCLELRVLYIFAASASVSKFWNLPQPLVSWHEWMCGRLVPGSFGVTLCPGTQTNQCFLEKRVVWGTRDKSRWFIVIRRAVMETRGLGSLPD